MSEQILLTACVELVTMNGRPLTMMKDSGFRKIIDPILVGLGSQGGNKLLKNKIKNFRPYTRSTKLVLILIPISNIPIICDIINYFYEHLSNHNVIQLRLLLSFPKHRQSYT